MIRRSSALPLIGDRYADPARPSRLLMQAVLEDGIRSFLRTCSALTTRARRLWREEFEWLTSHDQSHPFAFESICDALGIDAQSLRDRVLAAGRLATARRAHSLTTPRGTIPYRCNMR